MINQVSADTEANIKAKKKVLSTKIVKFMEQLDENDDVHEVFANFDVPDEVFAEVG